MATLYDGVLVEFRDARGACTGRDFWPLRGLQEVPDNAPLDPPKVALSDRLGAIERQIDAIKREIAEQLDRIERKIEEKGRT